MIKLTPAEMPTVVTVVAQTFHFLLRSADPKALLLAHHNYGYASFSEATFDFNRLITKNPKICTTTVTNEEIA